MKAKGKIWIISEGTKISARRRGFNIVPDFGQTAHSMQGASEVAVIVDCFTVDHCAKYSETLAAYIGISRVRTKEGLLIAEPFSTALFCHGQPPGPEILMKVLRREITPDDAKQDNFCSLCLYLFLLRTAPKQQCSVAHVMYAFASAEVFCIFSTLFERGQELDELVKKQRDESVEKNFKKMRFACKSCKLSADPDVNQNFMKPLADFNVRKPSDFIKKLLPQGAWARCCACQGVRKGAMGAMGGEKGGETNNISEAKRRKYGKMGGEYGKMGGDLGGDTNNIPREKRKDFGKLGKDSGALGGTLGGSTNNAVIKERSLAAAQACETCAQCGRSLTAAHFWLVNWRHRMTKDRSITCKECCPKPPDERLSGYMAKNAQKSSEAAAKPITCQICERSLPRSQFRTDKRGKFDFRKGMTCEQCRAGGKVPTAGWKKRRAA